MKKRFLALFLITIMLISIPSVSMANGLLDSVKDGASKIITQQIENLKGNIHVITDVTKDVLGELVDLVTEKFSDVKKSAWYIDTIAALVGLGILDGYPDGTLKPNGTLQVDEFTKMLVSSLGYEVENGSSYWASTWIAKAEELGLVKSGEFNTSAYKKPINRGQMARMIVRAMEVNGERDYPSDMKDYSSQLNDYNSIPTQYKEYVLKAYVKGIVTGYGEVPNATFKYNNNATRAEAATMIVRLLDEEQRKVPVKVKVGGINTIESLGLKVQPISNYGKVFVDPKGFYKQQEVVIIKKSHFPLQIGVDSYLQLKDLHVSQDRKEITLTTKAVRLNGEVATSIGSFCLATKKDGISRWRNALKTEKLSDGSIKGWFDVIAYTDDRIDPNFKNFTLNSVEYIVFASSDLGYFVALPISEVLK